MCTYLFLPLALLPLSLITVILIIAITIIKNIICAMFVIMSHLFPQSPLRYLTALTILGTLQMHLTNFFDKDPPLSFHPLRYKCCSDLFTFCKSVLRHTPKIQEDGKIRFRNSMLLQFPFFRKKNTKRMSFRGYSIRSMPSLSACVSSSCGNKEVSLTLQKF